MTKSEYIRKQTELTEEMWQEYDNKDYAKADEIYAKMEALVDPELDEVLTGDEGLLIFPEDVGGYDDVVKKHSWMRKTY